ncbi:MAG: zinc ribbon domain-containing protein [Leptospiraceae bacterium]|nr:zinc ribbon domain-containing protein [Leptospiraceae bacterium]
MDFLLILYSLILLGLIGFPFYYLKLRSKQVDTIDSGKNFLTKRKMLMENLRDLKAEKDSGKYSNSEFSELTKELVSELEQIDLKISAIVPKKDNNQCSSCGFLNPIKDANFCAMCGTKLA